METVINFILSKIPGLDMLNGYKVLAGRIIGLAGAILLLIHQAFPEIPNLEVYYSALMTLAGWGLFKVGQVHDSIKEQLEKAARKGPLWPG